MAASFLPLASHKSLVSSAPPLHILLVDKNIVNMDMDKGRESDMDEDKIMDTEVDVETWKGSARKDSKAFQQASAAEQGCNSCQR